MLRQGEISFLGGTVEGKGRITEDRCDSSDTPVNYFGRTESYRFCIHC